jgi:hypothetical protein
MSSERFGPSCAVELTGNTAVVLSSVTLPSSDPIDHYV